MKNSRNVDYCWVPVVFAASAASLLAFFLLSGAIFFGDATALDPRILLALRQPGDLATPIGSAGLNRALEDITPLGDTTVLTLLVVGAAGYLLAARKSALAIQLAATALLGASLNTLTKILVQRPRPDIVPHLTHFSSNSFPSGHAFNSTVVFLTIGILLARAEPRHQARAYLLAVAALMPLTIGLTRIYLGVHWPSDVLAGWCFGGVWVWVCLRVAMAVSGRRA